MTVTSADPSELGAFVSGTSAPRISLRLEQLATSGLQSRVAAASSRFSVAVPSIDTVGEVIEGMYSNERFVAAIRTALLAADQSDTGVVTITGAKADAALAAAGVGTPPAPVTFEPNELLGEPPTSGLIDDPICAANGNMIHRDVDLEFAAVASALDIDRSWNSLADTVGAFGPGWASIFDVRLDLDGSTARLRTTDGATIVFRRTSDAWSTLSRCVDRLIERDASGGFVVECSPDAALHFDVAGSLTGWTRRLASVSVERDAGRIVRLAESTSGRNVSIVWNGERIERLESGDGRFVDYKYGAAGLLERVTSAAGSLTYQWSADRSPFDLLVSMTDSDGVRAFVNSYDDDRRVSEQISPFGRTTSYRYDDSGTTVITDGDGVRQAMVHDARGNLTAVIDTDGSAMNLHYDDGDRVVRIVSRSGATWRHEFDPVTGDLVARHDPDGLTQRWEWDERRRLATSTDRAGGVTSYAYAGDRHTPSRVTDPEGGVATAEFDDAGFATRITDADGVERRLEWTRDGQVTRVTDALGAVTTSDFDETGLLTRIVDPVGTAAELVYEHHRVVRRTHGDAEWTYRRTAAGRIAGGTEPNAMAWTATFGDHGAVEAMDNPTTGSSARITYDHIGQMATITGADGVGLENRYDEVGRHIETLFADGTAIRKRYDVEGNLIEFVDPDGRSTTRTVDDFGRTATSTAPDGAVTTWTYHPNGEVASVELADGRTWVSELDGCGRTVAVTDPAGGRSEREFSSAGRLLSRTSPAGRVERFEYDAAGRCSATVGVDGQRRVLDVDPRGRVVGVSAGDDPAQRIGIDWDAHHRVVGHSIGGAETRFARNAVGQVVAATDPTGATVRFDWSPGGLMRSATDAAGNATTYEYDAGHRLTAQHAPGGHTTTWTHDALGRVLSMTDPAGVTTDVQRSRSGTITGLICDDSGWTSTLDSAGREAERRTLDGELLARYDYDATGRLAGVRGSDDSIFSEFLWDHEDRISAVTDTTGTSTVERDADGWVVATTDPNGVEMRFRRDARGRIIAVTSDASEPGDVVLATLDQVERDPAGRLLIGPTGTVYRYDLAGRLIKMLPSDAEPTGFEYDDDGLIAVETGPGGTRRFSYDTAGRVAAIDVDGVGRRTIGYDRSGRRSHEIAPDGERVDFGWDPLDRLVEITRTTADGEQSIVRLDLDGLGRPLRINGHRIGHDPLSGRVDAVDDVSIVNVDDVRWRSDDGSTISTAGAPEGLAIGSSLTLLGARVYDSGSRQFLSPDPLMTVPGSNGASSAYTFAWHDPVNFVDPTGLKPISRAQFAEIRKKEESGKFGQAWDAVKADPWGTLLLAGTIVVGGALVLTGAGTVVGAAILVGAIGSTAVGVATENFSPTGAALTGIASGVGAWATPLVVGAASTTAGGIFAAGATNAGISGTTNLVEQGLNGGPFDAAGFGTSVLTGFGGGALGGTTSAIAHGAPTGSIASRTANYLDGTTSGAAIHGGVSDSASSVTSQLLTGDHRVDGFETFANGLNGAAGSSINHHFAPTEATPSALDLPEPPAGHTTSPSGLYIPEAPTGAGTGGVVLPSLPSGWSRSDSGLILPAGVG